MTLNTLSKRLTQYEEQEARSVVRLLLFNAFGIGLTEICCGALDTLSPEQQTQLETMMTQLESGVPVQYVTGMAEFYGRTFHVAEGVLIPRPETEELITAVLEKVQEAEATAKSSTDNPAESSIDSSNTLNILDIGTGSGCIAVTMGKEMPKASVTAWDISEEALTIAQDNATTLEANVTFEKVDVLKVNDTLRYDDASLRYDDASLRNDNASLRCDEGNNGHNKRWDIIISNPPYICDKEKADMKPLVLDNEPDIALFVPDEEPLLFYRTIAQYAAKTLNQNGLIAFEINPIYAAEMVAMMNELNFTNIELREDQYGKQRMLLATRTLE